MDGCCFFPEIRNFVIQQPAKTSCSNWVEMYAIVLEKERFMIKVIPAVDEIDTFIYTNGLKMIISAEDPLIESSRCTTPGKDS